MPPYTLVESKIANFAHYRRVNGQETDAYSSSRKPRRTLYSLLVQTAIDPQVVSRARLSQGGRESGHTRIVKLCSTVMAF